MEDGSLLQTALQHSTQQSDALLQQNCLWLDIFSVQKWSHMQDHLLFLAKLADECNAFLHSQKFQWHYGCDGPVFGVHLTDRIPHLRAYCRYGPNVLDEWIAISYLRQLTQQHREVAGMAWDKQDGQVILIQLADLLPEWLDEDSSDKQRYSCWFLNGNLQLFRKSHMTLLDALENLQSLRNSRKDDQTSTHPKLQKALVYWLELNQEESKLTQRTPVTLPRRVARFFQDRPELVHTAIQAFCQYLESKEEAELTAPNPSTASAEPNLSKYEDWVWTVQNISRTNFAMLRTMVSPKGVWSDANCVPLSIGVEAKRLQRQCRNDSSQHLKHAVSFGVRVLIGLELLLQKSMKTTTIDGPTLLKSIPLPSIQERMLYWNRIEGESCPDDTIPHHSKKNLLQCFQVGPNQSRTDLTYILKCPVFPEESCNLTLRTAPESSLRNQILMALKKYENSNDDMAFPLPRQDQVDGEEWMDMQAVGAMSGIVGATHDLDLLLSQFQTFMNQTSEAGGVASGDQENSRNNGRIEIRPHIFMNILHATLKGEKLTFPTLDPFFYDEDYDLMDETIESNQQGADQENPVGGIMDLMVSASLVTALTDIVLCWQSFFSLLTWWCLLPAYRMLWIAN
jgi:hypothetical protein